MMKKYVAPNKDLTSYTCPHCNTISQMDKSMHKFQQDMTKNHNTLIGSNEIDIANVLTIHRCQCCGKKIIWVDDNYIYPDIVTEEANSAMPKSVKTLYNEASLIYNKSPRAACALLRLAVERLCHELGETDCNISKNISALVQKGLPTSVQQALDVVRVVGNKAVHPGQIEFDVDDKNIALMLMHLLNIIVERMIAEPQEINSLYQRLPVTIKEAVANRDKK